jgi:hypothetical protein
VGEVAGYRFIKREERELDDGTLVWWFESSVKPGRYVVALLMPNGQEMSTLAESPEQGIGDLLEALDATVRSLKKLALSEGVLWLQRLNSRLRR